VSSDDIGTNVFPHLRMCVSGQVGNNLLGCDPVHESFLDAIAGEVADYKIGEPTLKRNEEIQNGNL